MINEEQTNKSITKLKEILESYEKMSIDKEFAFTNSHLFQYNLLIQVNNLLETNKIDINLLNCNIYTNKIEYLSEITKINFPPINSKNFFSHNIIEVSNFIVDFENKHIDIIINKYFDDLNRRKNSTKKYIEEVEINLKLSFEEWCIQSQFHKIFVLINNNYLQKKFLIYKSICNDALKEKQEGLKKINQEIQQELNMYNKDVLKLNILVEKYNYTLCNFLDEENFIS